MEDLRHWTEILLESYTKLVDGLIFALPRIIAGAVLFLLGWLLAKLFSRLISRSLKALKFDKMMERVKLGDFLKRLRISSTPSQLAGKFIYWLVMLLMIVGFADALNLEVVSQKIGVLINYLPNIILAALILIIGLFLAGKVQQVIQVSMASQGIRAGRMIGNIIFYIISVFIILTALEQLKFNIDLLTSNVMILLGGVALAFSIGYGLAAKEIFPNIISSYYGKNMFAVGDTIRLAETEGEILEITNISVVLQTPEGKRYIPAKKFVTEEVDIISH
jgi:small-conductance mechanosensitive channel